MDYDTYRLLSSLTVHVNPKSSPQSLNLRGIPTLGGFFQETGALLALNELGSMVGRVLWLADTMVKPSTERSALVESSFELLSSIGRLNMNTIEDCFNEIRETIGSNSTNA